MKINHLEKHTSSYKYKMYNIAVVDSKYTKLSSLKQCLKLFHNLKKIIEIPCCVKQYPLNHSIKFIGAQTSTLNLVGSYFEIWKLPMWHFGPYLILNLCHATCKLSSNNLSLNLSFWWKKRFVKNVKLLSRGTCLNINFLAGQYIDVIAAEHEHPFCLSTHH